MLRLTDATHIVLEKCSHCLKQNHNGGKLPHIARTFNLTVNHRRQILATTKGYPARWNDKTLIHFDNFARGIFEGNVMEDVIFRYKGPYLIVDNGYLSWSTTAPLLKWTAEIKEVHWSEWLESLRKDVECTYGILKGRWWIRKTGIHLHGGQTLT